MKIDTIPSGPVISDPYNRHINYLRISVTDRCNLKCIYCRPDGKIEKLAHHDILRYEEILRIVSLLAERGLAKIRITGGEPLVRKGIFGFLRDVTAVPGIQDVSLTTNGVLLKKHLREIYDSGVGRLNISLDSLQRDKFKRITGFDLFNRVWSGILAAEKAGFYPIKINVVTLRGVNDDEIVRFAELTHDRPFHVRFIEHMPIGKAALDSKHPILSEEIETRLHSLGRLVPVDNGILDGPARRYKYKGAAGEIGIISPISHHFCAVCNRLRLTSNGLLRPCLLSDYHEDLKTPLRKGCSDDQLIGVILKTIENKPSGHGLTPEGTTPISGQMSSIGG